MELITQKAAEEGVEVPREICAEYEKMADDFMKAYSKEELHEAEAKGITRESLYDEGINYELAELLKEKLCSFDEPTQEELQEFYDVNYGAAEDPPLFDEVREDCIKALNDVKKNNKCPPPPPPPPAESEITRYVNNL